MLPGPRLAPLVEQHDYQVLVRIEGEPLGIAFAFANAALFAGYIVLAHRIARNPKLSGIDGLGAAMLVAAVAITPIGAWSAAPALLDPIALAAGIGVGISSSVIPYVCDQLAMARLSRASYSLMVALLPATATVIGVIVLAQVPTRAEVRDVANAVMGRTHAGMLSAASATGKYPINAVAALAADPSIAKRNGGSFSSGELAREYGFTDVDGSRPDAWRYVREVQEAGKPADATGYR